jgi:hypothetical protein
MRTLRIIGQHSIFSIVLLSALLASSVAQAHIVLLDPPGRSPDTSLTINPCGGIQKSISVAWFTYDTALPDDGVEAQLGDPGHRWLTAAGEFDGDQAVFDISITSGGLFDTATDIKRRSDGTLSVRFTGCNSGSIDYDIPSIGLKGTVLIQRVANDNVAMCEALSN